MLNRSQFNSNHPRSEARNYFRTIFRFSPLFLYPIWLVLTFPANAQNTPSSLSAKAAPQFAYDTMQVLQDVAGLHFDTWKVRIGPAEKAENPAFDDSSWIELPATMSWTEVHAACCPNNSAQPVNEVWFRGWLLVPQRIGVIPIHRTGIQLHSTNRAGKVEIFCDGNLTARFGCEGPCPVPQTESMVLANDAQPGQRISIVVHVTQLDSADDSHPASLPVFVSHWTEWSQTEPLVAVRLFFDEIDQFQQLTSEVLPSIEQAQALLNLATGSRAGSPPSQNEAQWRRIYQNALRTIDLTALEAKDFSTYKRSLETCLSALRELDPLAKAFEIDVIPLSNFYIGGAVPEGETVKALSETSRNLLQLMAERPSLKISQTQAGLHDMLQTYYPELHTALRQVAQQNRYEVAGAGWIGCNASVLSGESIIRQLLYGVHYAAREYGQTTDTAVLPETCAYAPNLPGLLRGCGIQNLLIVPSYPGLSFMSVKAQASPRPAHVLWWEGPDKNRVLVYFPPDGIQGHLNRLELIQHLSNAQRQEGLRACGIVIGAPMAGMQATEKRGWVLTTPLLNQAESLHPLSPYPTVRFNTVSEWFSKLRRMSESGSSAPGWPVCSSDLNVALPRGTFSVQPRLKQQCRELESELLAAERYAAIAARLGDAYPMSALSEGWVELLTHQSHPFMSGLASPEVYQAAVARLTTTQTEIAHLVDRTQTAIGHQINTALLTNPLIIHNPVSWIRNGHVEVQLDVPTKQARVTDTFGTDVPSQLITHADGTQSLLIETRELPPFGFNTLQVDWENTNRRESGPLHVGRRKLENRWFRLELDKRSGGIHSLFDKTNQREIFQENGGAFWTIVTEIPSRMTPWEERRGPAERPGSADTIVLEEGPVRASVRATQTYGQSRLTQTFSLYADSPWIDVDVDVEWNESLRILQIAFPLQTNVRGITCETGNAYVDRERDARNIPGLNWVDVSSVDRSYGVALLDNGRYAYDLIGQTLSMTVVRSPTANPAAPERGNHHFRYRLMPHNGKWQEHEIPLRALELNQPLSAKWESVHVGTLRPKWSWLDISNHSIVCSAFKPAQDDPKALLIRVHEVYGQAANAIITLPATISNVLKCNHLEFDTSPVPHNGTTFETWLDAYETASYLVYLESDRF